MIAWRLRLQESLRRELLIAAAWSLGTALLAYIGARKLGTNGLLVPLRLVLLIPLMRRPLAMVTLTTALVILCEGSSFGLFNFTSPLYTHVYRQLTPVDFL